VLQGDLENKLGATVKQGDNLIEIGKPNNLKVELKIADRDIQDVKLGQSGTIATLAFPGRKFPIKIDNIVPKPNAEEGDNRFTVYGSLDPENRSQQWLPGETGEARIDIRPEPLIWQWTHRLTEWARLKLWI
jgi:multidrug efflux pump subunit AcrA (membrane-fusion protein)